MKNFKYLIIGYNSINGHKINAKLCFDDSDFDYWMGYFGIEGKQYDEVKNATDTRGWSEFVPPKINFNKSFVKVMTYKHIMASSESYKY